MKVAVIGSRGLTVADLGPFLPEETAEIVSGGAVGVDQSAARYAKKHRLRLKEFLPQYRLYGRQAPLMRNLEIIQYADLVLAFWDGESHGTRFVIDRCRKMGREVRVFCPEGDGWRAVWSSGAGPGESSTVNL